ncbi:uncharacterized protein [Halyomorpha halys]|uniref:uncharacterized protein isoform X2 n=1 Tax=Halyomorpha halys TaxID=286706 RepID=UPI0006D4F00F|nr:uncharacterized protein LOC106682016 isoform X2 [Halyomorpha halys]
MKISTAFLVLFGIYHTTAFSGDDKFLKKYAMMKVYESCFGQDVVKEVRMEMKVAASKCAGISPSAPGSMSPPIKLHGPSPHQVHAPVKLQSQDQHLDGRIPGTSGEFQHKQKLKDRISEAASLHESDTSQKQPPHLDLEKLQQAIMAGYNKQTSPQTFVQSHQPYMPPQHHIRPYQPYQPAPPLPNVYYPGYQPQPPYMQNPYPSYQQPIYQPGIYPTYYQGRSSRDLDVRGQLETLTNRVSGRIRNVTCVMQELGYLDANLEPDYGRMIDRIGRLPVAEELKKDMAEGVEFCRQFSQCVPDDRKDKFIQEMVRPMFFFRCYKHKKLEACIMKDVRERYNSSEDFTEDNLASDSRAAKEFPEDNMATAIYEFLYGSDNIDIDTLL